MTAEEYLYEHYGTYKISQLPDSFDFDNVIDMMKHYARQKCKEQREIIARDEVVDDTYYHKYIINAPEPEFE